MHTITTYQVRFRMKYFNAHKKYFGKEANELILRFTLYQRHYDLNDVIMDEIKS